MQVKDTMCTDVKTCKADTPIKDIATLMCFNKISGLPVVDDDNNVIGIISEKDILCSMFPDMKELVESGAKADFEALEKDYGSVLSKTVDDLMTRVVASVSPDMPILRAASMMWLRKIRRIPVTENNKLVGILSMGDVHKSVFQESLLVKKP
ncbi:MAG: CBS domain-containing protein [gamma proteobacterium symbiont of Bathyaustriella thionipta]|nr:CBS domain-containing protein [gamma proteobacterium symbiont of Bathyaustriella thionipta]MCU7950210.1 CBS domain-containing protein [gamma proteobacterium symbiont of Bathyaustriella thionipta]MCU7952040.1 CBS domain-containing protein [gamma proteobacterium symbiont of Bathyaustriella thionipta]MCU7956848.1 CBS domain-containing protein [gamma proteobacterium symbiont of Bathyaustriella thionipta]MCU7967171.1 CBS domain-containing protein [gamma proteobacterium symbiont of Bathyaustriella